MQSSLRTFRVTYADHIQPNGQLAPVEGFVNSTATLITEVQAFSGDGAIGLVERDTKRMVTACQRVPCPHTPAAYARNQLVAA